MEATDLESGIIALIIIFLLLFIDVFIRIFLVFYIPRNRKPTAALAWLLLIVIAPLLGTILFLVIGSTKLSRKRRHMQRQIDYQYQRFNNNLRQAGLAAKMDSHYGGTAQLVERLTSLAPTSGNSFRIINGYDTIITDMAQAISRGQSYVYVEFFALALDEATEPFFDALELAIRRGVKVYVLFDTLGSRKYPRYKEMKHRLTDMGAQWRSVLPISFKPGRYNRPDLRNHRKIVVVDNTDAYIGSLNMIDKTYHRKDDIYYVELATHLKGPSANQAAAVFASNWYGETGEMLRHYMKNATKNARGKNVVQLLPSGPGYPWRNNLKAFVDLINGAHESVIITNPYLVPDESLLSAITSAALRGVHVSILNSEAMDQWMVGHAQRSYYEQLIKAGVEISLYKKPLLVHSKYLAIDKKVAIIGSSNLDIRSFELNLECSAIIYEAKAARKLYKQHMEDRKNSNLIKLEQWRKRSRWQRFLDSVARLTSALQ